MIEPTLEQPAKLSWRFPRVFWFANLAELFERAAYYGVFISLTLYLTRMVGFNDVETGWITGMFAAILYFLPTFMGALADRIGFRRALILAFVLLTLGYALLGAFQLKSTAILSLVIIMFGGAIVKPVISGTAAKCSDDANRARAFSIFYMIVNVGAFFGKTVAKPLRTGCDVPFVGHVAFGLEYINYYAAAMAFCALVAVVLFYRNIDAADSRRSLREIGQGFLTVIRNFRFLCLIVFVGGFWAIQGQLYTTVPKYMIRLVGEDSSPEWIANINPFIVILLVTPITHLIRRFKPENAIGIGLFIIPFTALLIGFSPYLQERSGYEVSIFGWFSLHPITLMTIIGIGLQGLAECFLSPKFLEYASKQAPEGQVGLYLGYQHLTTFFSWTLTAVLSGYLLDWYCPDPQKIAKTDPEAYTQWQAAIETGSPMPEAYAHAHYIWFVWAGVGVAAFVGLMIFKYVTNAIDRKRETV